MGLPEPERQVEAILFAAEEPLDIESVTTRMKTKADVLKILESLEKQYKGRGINLVCIANKWSFRTASNLSKLMNLQIPTQKKLSKAAIETLVIIVAFESFFWVGICKFINFERLDAVLKDHLFAIQTKFIPLPLYCFSSDSNILSTSAFVFILVVTLSMSRGSSAANKIASTCLSGSGSPIVNFIILEYLLLLIFFL
jgi:hypothetical protein